MLTVGYQQCDAMSGEYPEYSFHRHAIPETDRPEYQQCSDDPNDGEAHKESSTPRHTLSVPRRTQHSYQCKQPHKYIRQDRHAITKVMPRLVGPDAENGKKGLQHAGPED